MNHFDERKINRPSSPSMGHKSRSQSVSQAMSNCSRCHMITIFIFQQQTNPNDFVAQLNARVRLIRVENVNIGWCDTEKQDPTAPKTKINKMSNNRGEPCTIRFLMLDAKIVVAQNKRNCFEDKTDQSAHIHPLK